MSTYNHRQQFDKQHKRSSLPNVSGSGGNLFKSDCYNLGVMTQTDLHNNGDNFYDDFRGKNSGSLNVNSNLTSRSGE